MMRRLTDKALAEIRSDMLHKKEWCEFLASPHYLGEIIARYITDETAQEEFYMAYYKILYAHISRILDEISTDDAISSFLSEMRKEEPKVSIIELVDHFMLRTGFFVEDEARAFRDKYLEYMLKGNVIPSDTKITNPWTRKSYIDVLNCLMFKGANGSFYREILETKSRQLIVSKFKSYMNSLDWPDGADNADAYEFAKQTITEGILNAAGKDRDDVAAVRDFILTLNLIRN